MTTINKFLDTISNEDTAALPAIEFKGEIRIIDNERDVAPACKFLMKQHVIGFDTETRPSFRPGVTFRVSLLQLSTPKLCFLFRLNKISFAKPILQLLEEKDVLKIGADVAGDLRSLRQIRHFRDGGFVDLQAIASDWGIEEKSLRKLSAIVLGQRVSKAQRLSNWEATTFTDKQKLYAATDAWVCTQIYDQLLHTPKAKKASTPASQPKPIDSSSKNSARKRSSKANVRAKQTDNTLTKPTESNTAKSRNEPKRSRSPKAAQAASPSEFAQQTPKESAPKASARVNAAKPRQTAKAPKNPANAKAGSSKNTHPATRGSESAATAKTRTANSLRQPKVIKQ